MLTFNKKVKSTDRQDMLVVIMGDGKARVGKDSYGDVNDRELLWNLCLSNNLFTANTSFYNEITAIRHGNPQIIIIVIIIEFRLYSGIWS